LVKPDGDLDDPLLDRIQHELHDRFGIEHRRASFRTISRVSDTRTC
jgi:hypothetical protein